MSNRIRYKLTDQDMRCYGGYQYDLGNWHHAIGMGESLCTNSWLHCYSHPLIAVLMNPIHGNFSNPRLFRCEVKGDHLDNNGLKEGWKHLRLVKEIPVSEITLVQKVAFGILMSLEVYQEPKYVTWANNWLSGKDRSKDSAHAVHAYATRAYAAAAADAAHAARAYAHVHFHAHAHIAYTVAVAADAATDAADVNGTPINVIKIAKLAMKIK